jgi:FkbM family methyltransferase
MDLKIKSYFRSLFIRLIISFRWRYLSPKKPKIDKNNLPLICLGSKYGRKVFCNIFPNDKKLIVISAGVGEDISFDIELLNKFKAQVILVDPTPIAIKHFEIVKNRLGLDSKSQYNSISCQPVESYNLTTIKKDDLIFVPKALWNNESFLQFHLPPSKSRDNSGSINSIHNLYKDSNDQITVRTTTIFRISEEFNLDQIDILKLDIEGAALEVLQSMFEDKIYPIQILLEIDEMHFPSFISKYRARKLFILLKKNNYRIVNQDSCDFTFIRNEYMKL